MGPLFSLASTLLRYSSPKADMDSIQTSEQVGYNKTSLTDTKI